MTTQTTTRDKATDAVHRWTEAFLASMPRISKPGPVGWTFIALTVVALGTRLWDVGGRAQHYDEILHAWYSWLYMENGDYHHTPLTHGPFLFHSGALIMWLFGDNNVTVRLLPALFGTVLVALPYVLRRWLTTPGAIAAAVFLLVSPSVLYFGRFIRNDIYMAVYAVALLAIMWHYMHRPRTSLLVGWTIVWALTYTTKESSYFIAGIFGLFLIGASASGLLAWVRGRRKLSEIGPAGDLLIVLGTFSLPMWAPLVGLVQDWFGLTLVNPDPNDPRIAAGEVVRADTWTGGPGGAGWYIAVYLTGTLTAISLMLGLLWDRKRWPWLALIFVFITMALFTSIFQNWNGVGTGYWGSLGYWIAQHPVERANQPMYYYLIGLSLYEFLVFIPTLIGGAYLLIRGAPFDRFLVMWAALALVLFSVAGERMPWLLVGITVPMTLVAGRIAGMLFLRAWGMRFAGPGFIGGLGLMITLPFVVSQLILTDDAVSSIAFWLAMTTTAMVIGAATYLGMQQRLDPAVSEAASALGVLQREPRSAVLAAAGLGAMAVMLAFTVFVAGRAAYSYGGYERPNELLVYSQTGQETAYAEECIDRIARESGEGREGLTIIAGESDSNAWQWRWYLRNYPNVRYAFYDTGDPPTEPFDGDVVVISRAVEPRLNNALQGFVEAGDLHHLWWFPNYAYSRITPSTLWEDVRERESWQTVVDYFITRNYGPMQRSNGVIYVAERYAELAENCTTLRATEDDPLAG